MSRLLLVLFSFLIFSYSYAQFVVTNGFQVSKALVAASIGRTDQLGAWVIKGGFDVNKNGKKEIVVYADPVESSGKTEDTTVSIYLLECDGNDSYKMIWSYQTKYQQNSFGDVEVADMDKDGNSEIWVTFPAVVNTSNPNPPRLQCFEYNGTSIPNEPTAEWNYGVRDNFDLRPIMIKFDDVDNDNDVEIVMASRKDDHNSAGAGRTLIVASLALPLEQNGLNLFQIEMIDTSKYLTGGGIYDMKIVDFDGDGKKEIWMFTWDKYTVNIFESTGANTYNHEVEIRQATTPEDIGSNNGTHFYDINGDGKLEALIAGATTGIGKVFFIENTTDVSKLTTANMKLVGYNCGGDPRGAAIGDFDKDGKADFIFVDKSFNSVMMMEYNGSGSMSDSISYTWTQIFKDTTTTVASRYYNLNSSISDIDGDGYIELLVSNLNVLADGRPFGIILEASGKLSSTENYESVPSSFMLNQNYPNPFNPTTKISYSLSKSALVNIKVYNMLGQCVRELAGGFQNAGMHSVELNASSMPSGTYYYKITVDGYSEVRKMMLLK